jgi:hypothetical protein
VPDVTATYISPHTHWVCTGEDPTGGIYVAGAEEMEVPTFQDVLACLELGSSRRATGSTEMNVQSSRSHAIFSLIIEQHVTRDGSYNPGGNSTEYGATDDALAGDKDVFGGEVEYITSKFHFVDLAGSERVKKTKAEGERCASTCV